MTVLSFNVRSAPTVTGTNDFTLPTDCLYQVNLAGEVDDYISPLENDPTSKFVMKLESRAVSTVIRSENATHVSGKINKYIVTLDPRDVSSLLPGNYPITLSAPGTDTSEPIPETNIGEIHVVDASKYLSGNLRDRLGDDWLIGQATDSVQVAIRAYGATYIEGVLKK